MLHKSIFCKGFEIPEILFEQMRSKEGKFCGEIIDHMSVQVSDDLPYYQIIQESLVSLSSVIKKTRDLERQCRNEVEELKAQLKVKEFQWQQLQSEFDSLKSLNKDSIRSRYIELAEKGKILITP